MKKRVAGKRKTSRRIIASKRNIGWGIVILAFVIAAIYLLNNNTTYVKNIEDNYSYINVSHWGHMPLTYNYDKLCATLYNGRAVKQIQDALDFITKRTNNTITFVYQNSSDTDLMYSCNYDPLVRSKTERVLLGEEQSYSYQVRPTLYKRARIWMYSTFYSCSDVLPAVHIHETLHALGLEHPKAPYRNDIMSVYYLSLSQDCDLDIAQRDANYLINIYKK